jgi:hypothetical protein
MHDKHSKTGDPAVGSTRLVRRELIYRWSDCWNPHYDPLVHPANPNLPFPLRLLVNSKRKMVSVALMARARLGYLWHRVSLGFAPPIMQIPLLLLDPFAFALWPDLPLYPESTLLQKLARVWGVHVLRGRCVSREEARANLFAPCSTGPEIPVAPCSAKKPNDKVSSGDEPR